MSIYKGSQFIAGTPDLSEYAKSSDLLNAIYPVGSTYISTTNSCPLSTLISGSKWTQIASNVVVSVNTSVPIKGDGKTLGLTNGSANAGLGVDYSADGYYTSLDVEPDNYGKNVASSGGQDSGKGTWRTSIVGVTTDSSKSGIVGTVTRTNLTLYIFKRTA